MSNTIKAHIILLSLSSNFFKRVIVFCTVCKHVSVLFFVGAQGFL